MTGEGALAPTPASPRAPLRCTPPLKVGPSASPAPHQAGPGTRVRRSHFFTVRSRAGRREEHELGWWWCGVLGPGWPSPACGPPGVRRGWEVAQALQLLLVVGRG